MARRWSTALTGLALVLSGTAAVAAAAETPPHDTRLQAARTTRLTLAVSADEVNYGAHVTLSGKLTAGGKGLKGQKVVLRQRAGNARSYAKVATATTNRRGVWKKVVEARSSGFWIATFRGSGTYAGSKAAKQLIDVFAPLTDYAVSPGNRDAYLNETWTFTARTAPELAGSTVSLVRGPFRASTTVRTATIGPGGAIAVAHPMTVVGQQELWLNVNSSALMYGADSPHTVVRTRSVGAPTTPSIATASLPSVEVHVPYRANLVGGGGELTWGLVGGALPPGLALAPDGTVSGAPTATGTWSFTVQAANSAGSTTRTVDLAVLAGSLTVTTPRLYDARVGSTYPDSTYPSGGWQNMECQPCVPDSATWSLTAGALPPGMELGYNDFVNDPFVLGRPTLAGVYQFTVTGVVDGRSGSKSFSLRVLPQGTTPISIDFNPLNESVPSGTEGQPYSWQLTAKGETGLTWSAVFPLPGWLSLSPSGMLTGTPPVSGAGWIYVAATDGTRYDWQGFQLTVYES